MLESVPGTNHYLAMRVTCLAQENNGTLLIRLPIVEWRVSKSVGETHTHMWILNKIIVAKIEVYRCCLFAI